MCIGGTSGHSDDSVIWPSEYLPGMTRSGATDPAITFTPPSVFPAAFINSSPSASVSCRPSFYYEFVTRRQPLTLNPPTSKIWWVPNNASRWQMGFNSAFKGLNSSYGRFPMSHYLDRLLLCSIYSAFIRVKAKMYATGAQRRHGCHCTCIK